MEMHIIDRSLSKDAAQETYCQVGELSRAALVTHRLHGANQEARHRGADNDLMGTKPDLTHGEQGDPSEWDPGPDLLPCHHC